MIIFPTSVLEFALGPLVVGLVVGLVIRRLGNKDIERRAKMDAIKDLMTFRGDFSSQDFRRSLNKVSITFHDNEDIRASVRHLYDVINDRSPQAKMVERTIVGLIYKLCQKNGFQGLTEYDIDQAFPESKQEPESTPLSQVTKSQSESKEFLKTTGNKVNEGIEVRKSEVS